MGSTSIGRREARSGEQSLRTGGIVAWVDRSLTRRHGPADNRCPLSSCLEPEVRRYVRTIVSASKSTLKWIQPGAVKRSFELRDGEEVLGTLKFRNLFGSFATGESADGC